MILSELDIEELQNQSSRRDYPQWWSLCFLRGVALKTLNAALILPNATLSEASRILSAFECAIGRDSVLVRSDGGREARSYVRGGITYGHEDAILSIKSFLERGRAVILLEPTNRFSNKLSINITVDASGAWVAEGLGCGFDTSDLQRSLVAPQWGWAGNFSDIRGGVLRSESYRNVDVSGIEHKARVDQRLLSILDLLGSEFSSTEEVERFLKRSGNDCLFHEDESPSIRTLSKVVFAGKTVFEYSNPDVMPFTLAYARLWDLREIYWDITPGSAKWAR
jgi:hypothetical protein